jgi:hypothetical protein
VLHRSRADWPVVLASWVLLASALALLAAGTLYADAVTIAGLHRELETAPPADRSVVVRTQILADRLGGADQAVVPELERVLAPTGGDVVRVLRSSPHAEASAAAVSVTDLTLFAAYEGIEDHATLTAGEWATPGAEPVQATLSEGAAAALGVQAGDTMQLVSRLDASRQVEVAITGVWRADAADPWWMGESLALTGSEQGGTFTTHGPLVVAADDLVTGALTQPLDAQWRAIPALGGFTPANIDEIAGLAARAPERINAALPFSNRAQVLTKLPQILASVDRSVLVTQAGILLLLVQFGVLAAYAIVLVAALLLERRRTETALLRARGGGFSHLVAMSAGEALLVTAPAALAAPWLAALLVQAVRLNPALEGVGLEAPLPGPATFAISAVGGLIALLALTIPTVASSVNISGVRAAVGRQVGRTLPQRLGLDLVLVLLAVIALLQLRLYGAPITRNARGALGVDPLLVAAPAIGLLAGAVIAIRLVPRLAELVERLLARGRGLVPALAGRQIARRPLRYTRAALLLILAAALGTFASAHAATWTRSQADQASYATGADVRLEPGPRSAVPAAQLGGVIRAVPGVTAATPVVRAAIQLGTTLRDGRLYGIDATAMARVVRVRDDASGEATRAALRELGAARGPAPGLAIPPGTRRLSLTVDSAVTPVEGFDPVEPGNDGLTFSVLLIDADGRLVRVLGGTGELGVGGERLELQLTRPDGGSIPTPAMIAAVQLDVTAGPGDNVVADGTVDVTGLAASPDATGDTWTTLPMTGGETRVVVEGATLLESNPPQRLPERIDVTQLFASQRLTYQRTLVPSDPPVAPVLVGPAFLERTGASVGDTLRASAFGVPLVVHVVGEIDGFPTLDGSRPFALVDGLALDLVRLDSGAAPVDTSEWWIATADGSSASVAAAIVAAPIAAQDVVDRTAVQADLVGDPLALGVIGILGLGSIAALLFAAIGFLVSVTVGTAERLGELALLKALGLGPRAILGWLSAENLALLVVGLVAGVGLGLVLAWLALPFATLTANGEPPVPAPVVVVPPEALLPTIGLGLVLVLATILLVRRQLPGARTSAVLRARDE